MRFTLQMLSVARISVAKTFLTIFFIGGCGGYAGADRSKDVAMDAKVAYDLISTEMIIDGNSIASQEIEVYDTFNAGTEGIEQEHYTEDNDTDYYGYLVVDLTIHGKAPYDSIYAKVYIFAHIDKMCTCEKISYAMSADGNVVMQELACNAHIHGSAATDGSNLHCFSGIDYTYDYSVAAFAFDESGSIVGGTCSENVHISPAAASSCFPDKPTNLDIYLP